MYIIVYAEMICDWVYKIHPPALQHNQPLEKKLSNKLCPYVDNIIIQTKYEYITKTMCA